MSAVQPVDGSRSQQTSAARTEPARTTANTSQTEERSGTRASRGDDVHLSSQVEEEDTAERSLAARNRLDGSLNGVVRGDAQAAGGANRFKNPPGVKSELEGFDMNAVNDPTNNDPRAVFGRVAQNYNLGATHNKQECGEMLSAMVPELKAAGMDIVETGRDTISYRDPKTGDVMTIDCIRAAGGDRSDRGNTPGFAWQPVMKNGAPLHPESQQGVDGAQPSPGPDGGPVGAQQAGGAAPSGPDSPMTAELAEMQQKFMQVAQKYPLNDVETNKGAVQQRLAQMCGELKGAGVPVTAVCKDAIIVQLKDGSMQGVDVVVGAGGKGAHWGFRPSGPALKGVPGDFQKV